MNMLSGQFEINASPPYMCEVTVDKRGLVYRNVEDKQGGYFEKRLNINDIIGCHCLKDRKNSDDGSIKRAAYFCVYAYPLHKKTFSLKTFRRFRDAVTFKVDQFDTFEENLTEARKWKSFIASSIRGCGKWSDDETDSEKPSSPEITSVKSRKLLILVNPNSGPRKAMQLFNQQVKPVLYEAGVNYDVIITAEANHARDLVKTYNLFDWDGIVIVSGDGLIYEVINGIMQRHDWREVLKIPIGIVPGGSGNGLARTVSYSMREPYDTSNSPYNSMTASLNFIRGRVTPMDLVKVITRKETFYSFLAIGWGLFADIDIESEKMRNWGETRFFMRAFVRIAGLRLYKGKLSYLPIEGYVPPLSSSPMRKPKKNVLSRSKTINEYSVETSQAKGNGRLMKSHSITGDESARNSRFQSYLSASETVEDKNLVKTDADSNRSAASSNASNDEQNVELKSELSNNVQTKTISEYENTDQTNSEKTVTGDTSCDINSGGAEIEKDAVNSEGATSESNSAKESTVSDDEVKLNTPVDVQSQASSSDDDKETAVYIPPLDKPVPDNWIVEEDEYVMVYVSSVTHIGSTICLAPDARFDDGIMYLIIIRGNVSRSQIVEFCMCLEDGRHINSNSCSVIPIQAFRLEPGMPQSKSHPGYLTIDGEVIESGPIQGAVLPSVARIMTR